MFVCIHPHNPNQDTERFQHLGLPHDFPSRYATPLPITTILT